MPKPTDAYEVVANPQGDNAGHFPEIVVSVEADRFAAARKAWDLQSKTSVKSCLYSMRRKGNA